MSCASLSPTATGYRGGAEVGEQRLLVVGSINADSFIELSKLPTSGETVGASNLFVCPGGKGANQAVAAARLTAQHSASPTAPSVSKISVAFVGCFGNDSHRSTLKTVMTDNGVNIEHAFDVNVPSGQAFIFLERNGNNSIVILPSANAAWPTGPSNDALSVSCTPVCEDVDSDSLFVEQCEVAYQLPSQLQEAVRASSIVLLQREIPEAVNEAVSVLAHSLDIPVYLDVGGEDRPFSLKALRATHTISPNESELLRMISAIKKSSALSLISDSDSATSSTSSTAKDSDEHLTSCARLLQSATGVQNVLITLGSRGSLFVSSSSVVRSASLAVVPSSILDTTGAGDCFRAAFAVATLEGKKAEDAMKFAAAAAGKKIQRKGAMPGMPTRAEAEELVQLLRKHYI